MQITQRQAIIGVFLFEIVAALLGFGIFLGELPVILPELIGLGLMAPLLAGLLWAYMRGAEWARYGCVALNVILTVTLLISPLTDPSTSAVIFAPLAVALVMADWRTMVAVSIIVPIVVLIRAGGTGLYALPDQILAYAFIAISMIIGRLILERALLVAEAARQDAEAGRARAELLAEESAQRAVALGEQNEEQRRLLELVAALETPAISVAEGVLLIPLLGHFDAQRLERVSSRILHDVAAQRSRAALLDITGIPALDTEVITGLVQLGQALRLLGCRVLLSGVSPHVALALADHGLDLQQMRAVPSPREALALVLRG